MEDDLTIRFNRLMENRSTDTATQRNSVQSNVDDLVARFNRLENVQGSDLELPEREFNMEPYIIRSIPQEEIARQDRDRRVRTLKRNKAAKTLQRNFRNRRDRRGREVESGTEMILEQCVYMKITTIH